MPTDAESALITTVSKTPADFFPTKAISSMLADDSIQIGHIDIRSNTGSNKEALFMSIGSDNFSTSVVGRNTIPTRNFGGQTELVVEDIPVLSNVNSGASSSISIFPQNSVQQQTKPETVELGTQTIRSDSLDSARMKTKETVTIGVATSTINLHDSTVSPRRSETQDFQVQAEPSESPRLTKQKPPVKKIMRDTAASAFDIRAILEREADTKSTDGNTGSSLCNADLSDGHRKRPLVRYCYS